MTARPQWTILPVSALKKINGRALCKYPFSREKTLTTRGAGMDLATTEGLERGTRRLVPLSLSEPTSWLQIP